MKTLGSMKVVLLPLMILATTTGLFTVSPIPAQEGNILEENTSYRKENQKEAREESQANQIGKDYFRREILSLHTTLGKVNYEETKQLFLHNVLMEALDDGTPMYYNSNILGRYMRKDYGQFHEKS